MNMHLTAIMFLFFLTVLPAVGQDKKTSIVFEQKALDYFGGTILKQDKRFREYKARFQGVVDSSITTVQYEMTLKSPEDKVLEKEYLRIDSARRTKEFWQTNNRAPFALDVKKPLKRTVRKNYGKRSKILRLKVFQSKSVGDKNYVWFRGFIGNGELGYDIYFTLDKTGKVVDWYYQSFIF